MDHEKHVIGTAVDAIALWQRKEPVRQKLQDASRLGFIDGECVRSGTHCTDSTVLAEAPQSSFMTCTCQRYFQVVALVRRDVFSVMYAMLAERSTTPSQNFAPSIELSGILP